MFNKLFISVVTHLYFPKLVRVFVPGRRGMRSFEEQEAHLEKVFNISKFKVRFGCQL